jgi:hypothetical protein
MTTPLPEDAQVFQAPRHSYCPDGVDCAVQHKQAWARLTDVRSKGEKSIVHAHGHASKSGCKLECRIYHECKTDGQPRSHSIAEMCPEPEKGVVVL